ncbi:MAG: ChaN family lipoprotein [Pseudomonadota bacterium]|nr:ChaN family lipoprotein [Pseudomonadota bacterium]
MPFSDNPFRHAVSVLVFLLSFPLFAGGTQPPTGDTGPDEILDTKTTVVDLSFLTDMERLVDKLSTRRVVFVGESHDRYEDHLNQLAVIRGLHYRNKDLAIGMEFFQQPFQPHLDAFVAGEISEKELLRRTEYFERWRFDYRLYRPILRFARAHGIPIVALNLEREITEKVGDGGIDSLNEEERARIPAQIDREDEAYRERVRQVFEHHPQKEEADFEHFLEVQLLWDEGMADRAARYLREHPEKSMVILAGTGHLERGQGIPKRLLRRVPAESAIVLNGTMRELAPTLADFLLYPRRVELPASGLLGVMLDVDSEGEGIAVKDFVDTSGARVAGMEQGDRIVKVGEDSIGSYSDIRIALLGSRPGQKLPVEVLRKKLIGEDERLTFEVELH